MLYHALIPGLASQIATSAGEGYKISGNFYGSYSLSLQNISHLVWPSTAWSWFCNFHIFPHTHVGWLFDGAVIAYKVHGSQIHDVTPRFHRVGFPCCIYVSKKVTPRWFIFLLLCCLLMSLCSDTIQVLQPFTDGICSWLYIHLKRYTNNQDGIWTV